MKVSFTYNEENGEANFRELEGTTMDELIQVLWDYASKYWLEGCYDLARKTEREEGEKMAGLNRERLEAQGTLTKELDNLCDNLELVRTVDMEAAFICGLQLGLALK